MEPLVILEPLVMRRIASGLKTLAQAAVVQWWHAQALCKKLQRAWGDARIDYDRCTARRSRNK